MEIKEEIRTVRYIEYDGKRFYEDGKGYWLGQYSGEDGKPHRIRLHIYVWEKFHGPIPEGYDVHHIDHDPSNNEIDNLIALPQSEHHKLHMAQRDPAALTDILTRYARPAATQWHKSEAGRVWHQQQYQRSLAQKRDQLVTKLCEYCGQPYQVQALNQSHSRFCSNRCKTRFRYHSGADNVERTCAVCGKTFLVNKYARAKTCSRSCDSMLMVQSKTEAHRQKE